MSKLPDSFTKHHMHNSEEPSPNAEPEDLASKGAIRVQRRGRGREGGRGKQETREKVLVERENFCSRGKKEGRKEGREEEIEGTNLFLLHQHGGSTRGVQEREMEDEVFRQHPRLTV